MELSPKQQINELIKNSQSILVVSHSFLDGDSLGAMLSLDRVLTKIGKEVSLVTSDPIDDVLHFLPGLSKMKNDINGTRDFMIRLHADKTPIDKISYSKDGDFIDILITPKQGKVTQSEMEFIQGNFKFDLIFVLDTPDVEKIDKIYDRQTELFFETPIINIDHHAGNEYFGTVNLVDLTATSTCEILVSIIESFGAGNFDEDVATCLLTGLISDTGSFKNINTSPKSLTISAQMLAAGARQQEIIQNLYKTRKLDTLKLWGKILSKIDYNADFSTTISALSIDDLENKQANLADIRTILNEFLLHIPNTNIALILVENEPNRIAGFVKSYNGFDVLKIASEFSAKGDTRLAEFETASSLKTVLNRFMVLIAEANGKSYPNGNDDKSKNTPITQEVKSEPVENKKPLEETVLADFSEDPISKAIESIDNEIIDTNGEAPSIDVEDLKKQEETMKPLGSILETHQPGTALNKDEEEATSPGETLGKGNKNEEIRTWRNQE